MLTSRTRWKILNIEHEAADRLAEQCGVHPVVARLLLLRGFSTPEEVRRFMSSNTDDLYDPFLMDGMREAVEAVRQTIRDGGRIRIYGDYDADGISSTALLTWVMRELGAKFDYYIPHRVQEGYGLNKAALDSAKEDGISLILTVDTGISACEEALYAAELGLDLVITDHHEPPEQLPSALAILNPKKPGCSYPFAQLAGVGVAFKLAQALLGEVPEQLTELAALGTIADLMPLVDENRTIVQLGLKGMQRTRFPGLSALFHVSGLEGKEISAGHIGFAVAPRINASGRLTSADAAVELLTTEHEQEAYMLAKQLDELNRERQAIVEQTLDQALQQLEKRYGTEPENLPPVLICSGEDWNAGVIGIVAARLLERFYRPTIVFTIERETGSAKGSARSISGFDIYRALTECSDLLEHFGGHQAAAGMTIQANRLDELQDRMNSLANEWLTKDDFTPLTEADVECSIGDCTAELAEQLNALAPYGIGNRTPKFYIGQAGIRECRQIGRDGQHLKLVLFDRQTGQQLEAVGFGFGEFHAHLSPSAKVDLIGELQINEWNGIRKPQMLIQDLRVGHLQVFDWRGITPAKSYHYKTDSKRSYPGLRDDAAFIICDSLPRWKQVIGNLFGERPILVMDDQGILRTADDDNLSAPVKEPLTDIVLVQLPQSVRQLEQMLATYGETLERVCVWFADAEEGASGCPPRDSFKHIYACAKQAQYWTMSDDRLVQAWSRKSGLSQNDVFFVLNVFEDLGFITRTHEDRYELVTSPKPRDLSESRIYQKRAAGHTLAEEMMMMTSERLSQLIMEHAVPGNYLSSKQQTSKGKQHTGKGNKSKYRTKES